MKTADFDFPLPEELIAQTPAPVRDQSRLMTLDRNAQAIGHRIFSDITASLRPGDLLVVNNTKVVPARVMARKPGTGGKVELFFLEEVAPNEWDILLRSRRRPKPGERIEIEGDETYALMIADGELGRARIKLVSPMSALEVMMKFGQPPLPPYIKREEAEGGARGDQERYQTVYASKAGAVAAPTAGLHFTPELLSRLERAGVRRAEVTLHVGIGTFKPVEVENLEDHPMEPERYEISEETAELIRETKRGGGRVVAVGSTSVRTLEFSARETGEVRAGSGRANLYIYPPYNFRVVDAIITNFHLPKSTLLMMMSAFAGREFMLRSYAEAVRERYRFFSYGDAMFIQ
jgi:S-adenosylmethionine:tRNA ribosyltransferase-isomerase